MKNIINSRWRMGSCYGGLKQIDGFGPNKKVFWNIPYMMQSVQDLLMRSLCFIVILKKNLMQNLQNTFQNIFPVTYVYLEFDVTCFENDGSHREKPWGTAHAILAKRRYLKFWLLMLMISMVLSLYSMAKLCLEVVSNQ